MGSLVSATEKSILTGIFDQSFQTFQRDIVVFKEPIKQALVSSNSNPSLFGFGDPQVENEYIYTPVSGIFPAVVRYNNPNKVGATHLLQNTNVFVPVGEVKIKVQKDCYDFIESGKTDKIVFDNRDFYFAGKGQAYPFLGSLYYMYQLKPKP